MVVDASAVVALTLGASTPPASASASRIAAPEHLHIEAISALRRLLARRELTNEQALRALEELRRLSVDVHENLRLLPRIWALRDRLSAYDAAYVALALQLGCPIVTLDQGVAAVAATLQIEVLRIV